MALVTFNHTVKYNGNRYIAHTPFEVNNKDIALLQSQGAIILDNTPTVEPDVEEIPEELNEDLKEDESNILDESKQLKQDLMNYTVAELTAFAEERQIDLKGCTKKADIYNIIVSAL